MSCCGRWSVVLDLHLFATPNPGLSAASSACLVPRSLPIYCPCHAIHAAVPASLRVQIREHLILLSNARCMMLLLSAFQTRWLIFCEACDRSPRLLWLSRAALPTCQTHSRTTRTLCPSMRENYKDKVLACNCAVLQFLIFYVFYNQLQTINNNIPFTLTSFFLALSEYPLSKIKHVTHNVIITKTCARSPSDPRILQR